MFCLLGTIIVLLSYQYIYLEYQNNQIKKKIDEALPLCNGELSAEKYKRCLDLLDKAYQTKDSVYILRMLYTISSKLITASQYELAGKYICPEMLCWINGADYSAIQGYCLTSMKYYAHIGAESKAIQLGISQLNNLDNHEHLLAKHAHTTQKGVLLSNLIDLYIQTDSLAQAISCAKMQQTVFTNIPYASLLNYLNAMAKIAQAKGDTQQEYFYRNKYLQEVDSYRQSLQKPAGSPYGIGMLTHFLRLGQLEAGIGNTSAALKILDKSKGMNLRKALLTDSYLTSNAFAEYVTLFKLQDSLLQISGDITGRLRVKDSLLSATKLYYQAYNKQVFYRSQLAAKNTELEREIIRHQIQAQVYTGVLISGLIICLIIISALLYIIRNKNLIQQKNEAIYRLFELNQKSESGNKEGAGTEEKATSDTPKKGPYVNTETLQEIFSLIEKAMNEEHIYLNNKLKRSDLAKYANTNSTYIYMAVKHCTDFSHLNDYINSYRVKHACTLLKKNKHHNIESIAIESGFLTRQTCYRVFSQHLSMTPKEYARATENKSKRYPATV